MAKRQLFNELVEGIAAMKAQREGKITLRSFPYEPLQQQLPISTTTPDRGPAQAGRRRKPRLSSRGK